MFAYQVRVFLWVYDRQVDQFDIEILVHTVQLPTQAQIILELHNDLLANQRLEEGEEMLVEKKSTQQRQ